MSSKHLLHPELHPIADAHEADFAFSAELLPGFRAARNKTVVMGDPDKHGVTREEVYVEVLDGPDVRCLLYRPDNSETAPGYLHIHGGGYIVGSVDASDLMNINIASRPGVVVLSVDYRLAPETSIPGPLEDCYGGLAWLHQNADELGVDTDRIGLGGESAGGGLAAALAILARDRGEYPVCHQHLTYPMIDNLTGSPGYEGDPLTGEFVWTREHNQFGWAAYLGDAEPVAPQVPARLANYEGLPPTWMFTAALDLFRDENISYAQNLLAAGVPTELIVYPGACHGFQMLPGNSLAKRFTADHLAALARGLGADTEKNNG